jgi:hypothetical protein
VIFGQDFETETEAPATRQLRATRNLTVQPLASVLEFQLGCEVKLSECQILRERAHQAQRGFIAAVIRLMSSGAKRLPTRDDRSPFWSARSDGLPLRYTRLGMPSPPR